MRKNPSYMALLISEKSATYTIKWSYTIIWQVRVCIFFFCFYFVHMDNWMTTCTNKVIIECNFTMVLASLLCWSSMFGDYWTFGKKNNIWPCHWTKLIGFGRWSIQKNRSLSSLKVPFLIVLVLVPLSLDRRNGGEGPAKSH